MKPRRDITLGEMQDECKRFTDGLCGGKSCAYQDLCNQIVKSGCTPHAWDLTDPPRFNEAQMAFWRGWYEMGVRKAASVLGGEAVNMYDGIDAFAMAGFTTGRFDTGLGNGETLNIAELFGKDGENNARNKTASNGQSKKARLSDEHGRTG